MISKRDIYLVITAGILALMVVVGVHIYDAGKRKVALVATQDSLKVVVKQSKIIASQRDSIGKLFANANAKSNETRIIYIDTKKETTIKGDSAFDGQGKFIQVLDPRITQRITSADNHISSLESQLEVAVAFIKVDTVYIKNQDEQIRLNQNIAKMVKGSVISRGFQIGGGYCRTPTGGTPCVYVGYGLSARL